MDLLNPKTVLLILILKQLIFKLREHEGPSHYAHLKITEIWEVNKSWHRVWSWWGGPSSQRTQLCCPKVFNKMEIFWHFHENFEVRYLEKVYNFSAILLQWNIIKFVERDVEWCIYCVAHREVTLLYKEIPDCTSMPFFLYDVKHRKIAILKKRTGNFWKTLCHKEKYTAKMETFWRTYKETKNWRNVL